MTEIKVESGIPGSQVSIIVNGRKKVVDGRTITYRQLIALAFDPVPTGPNIEFTVTYRNGPPENPKGTMVQGDSVHITNGMVFNVTYTDKS